MPNFRKEICNRFNIYIKLIPLNKMSNRFKLSLSAVREKCIMTKKEEKKITTEPPDIADAIEIKVI